MSSMMIFPLTGLGGFPFDTGGHQLPVLELRSQIPPDDLTGMPVRQQPLVDHRKLFVVGGVINILCPRFEADVDFALAGRFEKETEFASVIETKGFDVGQFGGHVPRQSLFVLFPQFLPRLVLLEVGSFGGGRRARYLTNAHQFCEPVPDCQRSNSR